VEVETLEEETSYRFEEVISVRRVVVLFMWADGDWVVERSIGVFGGGRDNFGRGADTGWFKVKSETTRMVAIMAEDRVADDLVETRVIGRCRRRRRRRVNGNGDLSHKCHGKMIDGVVRRTKGGDALTGFPSRGGGRLLGRSGASRCFGAAFFSSLDRAIYLIIIKLGIVKIITAFYTRCLCLAP
jgi:hypothetical protein